MTNEERIKADAWAEAESKCGEDATPYRSGYFYGYIAGATAENSKAQVLVDALETIIKNGENIRSTYKIGKPAFYIKAAREALEQWRGKEVEP